MIKTTLDVKKLSDEELAFLHYATERMTDTHEYNYGDTFLSRANAVQSALTEEYQRRKLSYTHFKKRP